MKLERAIEASWDIVGRLALMLLIVVLVILWSPFTLYNHFSDKWS